MTARVRGKTAAGRFSRRWLLTRGSASGAGLVATFASACGGGTNGNAKARPTAAATTGGGAAAVVATAAAAEQPKRGGTHRAAQTSSLSDVMDPHTSLNQAAQIWSFIGNTALRLNRDATELIAELVEKWEIPGDGFELLLHVRQGVKWHDKPPVSGRAFDGEDLAYNLQRIAGKLNPNDVARFQRRTDLRNQLVPRSTTSNSS